MRVRVDRPGEQFERELDQRGLPTRRDWERVLGLAWRPAWSMRSRKGSLALLASWLRRSAGRKP